METLELKPYALSPYPVLADRIQSTFIDVIFLVLLTFVFSSILDYFDNVPDWVRISLFAGLWVVYEPVCVSFGCTVGNYLKHIRVRRHNRETERINIFQALVRYLVKLLLGGVSFLTMHSNPERRAIHDFAAGSVMAKV